MLKEIIVVEGWHDAAAVRTAVDAEIIVTSGYMFSAETLERIRLAQKRRGVIILTDPDSAGERIRRRIDKAVPGCRHAYLARADAEYLGDIGVENASSDSITEALSRAHAATCDDKDSFTLEDMQEYGLIGCSDSDMRRQALSGLLGIGRCNGKQFLNRLNHYGVSRAEFLNAVSEMDKESGI